MLGGGRNVAARSTVSMEMEMQKRKKVDPRVNTVTWFHDFCLQNGSSRGQNLVLLSSEEATSLNVSRAFA